MNDDLLRLRQGEATTAVAKMAEICWYSEIGTKFVAIAPRQKFLHKQRKTVYVVKSIQGKTIFLVSETGKSLMTIQAEILHLAFDPLFD